MQIFKILNYTCDKIVCSNLRPVLFTAAISFLLTSHQMPAVIMMHQWMLTQRRMTQYFTGASQWGKGSLQSQNSDTITNGYNITVINKQGNRPLCLNGTIEIKELEIRLEHYAYPCYIINPTGRHFEQWIVKDTDDNLLAISNIR